MHKNLATHVLVFMVRGITIHWKQIVGYFFTGDSMKGEALWETAKEIVVMLGKKNVNVRAIVSDMGACNQAMWNSAGVYVNSVHIKNCVDHPHFANQQLYFLADIPHLLKNIRNCLLANNILLPLDVVTTNSLPNNTVSVEPVHQLVELQNKTNLKIAPSLTAAHIKPGQYEKMKVSIAAQFFSHSTASALRFLSEHGSVHENSLTTAWFLDFINAWFDACNARFSKAALFPQSQAKLDVMHQAIQVFSKMKFTGKRPGWKPIQTGVLLSTKSLLDLFDVLVMKSSLKFLLTGRFTQDSLENLFSQLRGFGDSHPSPVQLRHNLRLICLAQFMQIPKYTSYEKSDDTYLLSFFKKNIDEQGNENFVETVDKKLAVCSFADYNDNACICYEVETSTSLDSSESSQNSLCNYEPGVEKVSHKLGSSNEIGFNESNALYFLAGWVCFKLKTKVQSCTTCTVHFSSGNENQEVASLVKIKSFGSLVLPSDNIFQLINSCEKRFRTLNQWELMHNQKLVPALKLQFQDIISESNLPLCHNIADKAVVKYLKLHLHIFAKSITHTQKLDVQHGSKSAKARTLIK